MNKYNSLGELFIAYRKHYDLSQLDFAYKVNVDVRTVQRWEKDVTLIKSEKEEDIVLATLLPYQLVRNLNATVAIPTFYDFFIRKYSLNELSTELPDTIWFKEQLDISTTRLRRIDVDYDMKYISHFINSQQNDLSFVNEGLIKEAIRILPELNFILTDDAGYYAGHSIVLPISEKTYRRLKNKEITKDQLTELDLTNYESMDRPIFFNYDLTADCNDNIFYLIAEFLRFFKDFKKGDYLICSYTLRYDSLKLSQDSGMRIVWEDEEKKEELGLDVAPRFVEGNYNKLLM